MWQQKLKDITEGDFKVLARCISLVENESDGYEQLLMMLPHKTTPVIGITGPPGAGKSTLVDALIQYYVGMGNKVAVLCIDPSSPFNLGAVLGDRIRMSNWYNHPSVFIRSLASRGSLGGLHPKIIEICDLMKAAAFDLVIVETVGVGQSEIEIAGLADVTAVVLVPESGDEVQTMKSGLMEIADLFIVNKADRPGADSFVKNLRSMLAPAFHNHSNEVEVIKTTASKQEGIEAVAQAIEKALLHSSTNNKRYWLLAEKAYHLIQNKRMKDIDKEKLKTEIEEMAAGFNLYNFIQKYI